MEYTSELGCVGPELGIQWEARIWSWLIGTGPALVGNVEAQLCGGKSCTADVTALFCTAALAWIGRFRAEVCSLGHWLDTVTGTGVGLFEESSNCPPINPWLETITLSVGTWAPFSLMFGGVSSLEREDSIAEPPPTRFPTTCSTGWLSSSFRNKEDPFIPVVQCRLSCFYRV